MGSPLRRLARSVGLARLRRRLPEWRRRLRRRLDVLPPRLRTIEYAGYTVCYSRGTSLIERIEDTGSYEPETVQAIARELRRRDRPVFADVGANIGLVSIGVLALVPDVSIFAWEPGPHQHDLFARTIARNGLDGRVELSSVALAAEPGAAAFSTHSTRHVSGDGFRDTGRAGSGRTIVVRTGTLDAWWEERGRPRVDLVKLDTEGSETQILAGARAFLAGARPTLLIEIHPANLQAYGLVPRDVVEQLGALGYDLETLAGERLPRENLDGVLASVFEYIARPR